MPRQKEAYNGIRTVAGRTRGNRDCNMPDYTALYGQLKEKEYDLYFRTDNGNGHAGNEPKVLTTSYGYRIRKLTPRSCGRLMNVFDEDISKMEAVNSNSQLYRQFGNSICCNVLVALFSQLNIQGITPWNKMTQSEKENFIYGKSGGDKDGE